jgi:hypothetical protein
MTRLDLDAQRAEGNAEPHIVVLAGKEWSLPPRFPLVVGQHMQGGDVEAAIAGLFGDDAVEVLLPIFAAEDIEAIADQLYNLNEKAESLTAATATNGNRATRRATARTS